MIEHGGAAELHLGKIGRIDLEGGRAVQHMMGVDLGAAHHIGLGRGPHDQSAHVQPVTRTLRHAARYSREVWPASGPLVLEQRIGQLRCRS